MDDLFSRMEPAMDGLLAEVTASKDYETKAVSAAYEIMHQYLGKVWGECYRALCDGGIPCINIGDATRNISGRFRLFANHAKIIEHYERLGFVTLPYILWKKPTNKPNAFLGSGFLPTNGYMTLDLEYVLIFRKGNLRRFTPKDNRRYSSSFTKAQRDVWFSQVWSVHGAAQSLGKLQKRSAAFPEEIPRRLVSMFSIIGDTILDPFLGTGTTMKAACELNRNSVGYELDAGLEETIREKLGADCGETERGLTFERIWNP